TLSVGVDEKTNSLIVACPDSLYKDIITLCKEMDEAASKPSTQVISIAVVPGVDPTVIQHAVESVSGMQGRRPPTTSPFSGSRIGGSPFSGRTFGPGSSGSGFPGSGIFPGSGVFPGGGISPGGISPGGFPGRFGTGGGGPPGRTMRSSGVSGGRDFFVP